jgi:Uma2 family endonuclease
MATAPGRVSPENYLEIDRRSDARHEYLDGQVYAMSGASRAHNRIALNLAKGLDDLLEARGCDVFIRDVRVRVSETGLYTYPDLVVTCGGARFVGDLPDTLENPVVIVEILSPSTEAYDRGAKFAHYRRIPTLREYVLVAQDARRVERFVRSGGEDWIPTSYDGAEAVLDLESVSVRIPLSAIYHRVS